MLFGCNYLLTKNKYKNETIVDNNRVQINKSAEIEHYYLRYFNFQHANSSLREAQLGL